MSANPIIYCLENLTDYREFERLCSDLMSGSGYDNIEPIGGTGDRGRDALDHCQKNNITTIFAYTVRSDWQSKLKQDCTRISGEGHYLQNLVFVCTSTLNGSQKDLAKSYVYNEYGWSLEIFDLERIRVLLAGNLKHLIAQHSSIFCPPWFPTKGGLSIAESRDTIIIDHTSINHALAIWLARKLSLAGYTVWCYGMAPLAGENINESINLLIDKRASQYLPILSPESFGEMDFITRIGNAIAKKELVTPCWADSMDDHKTSSSILQVEPARFYQSYKMGIETVLNRLKSRGITPQLNPEHGNKIALQAYMPEPVTKAESEKIYTNVFPITVPKAILVYDLNSKVTSEELDILQGSWAFAIVRKNRLYSFEEPPPEIGLDGELSAEFSWADYEEREGKKTIYIVKELIRKSFNVACNRAGLQYCDDRNVYYFPIKDGDRHNISFIHKDGRKTSVTMTGLIQDGWGDRATKFRYQLGPKFSISQDQDGQFWITIRVYVRVTDLIGNLYEEKEIGRKRKKVTKSWWNKQWLARLLGLMQGLSNNSEMKTIDIGTDKRMVRISTKPLEWDCPVSIDVEAVDRIGDFQKEMSMMRFRDEDEDDANVSE